MMSQVGPVYFFPLTTLKRTCCPFRTMIVGGNFLHRHSPDVRRSHPKLRPKEIAEMG
jgi:hypothetical protein